MHTNFKGFGLKHHQSIKLQQDFFWNIPKSTLGISRWFKSSSNQSHLEAFLQTFGQGLWKSCTAGVVSRQGWHLAPLLDGHRLSPRTTAWRSRNGKRWQESFADSTPFISFGWTKAWVSCTSCAKFYMLQVETKAFVQLLLDLSLLFDHSPCMWVFQCVALGFGTYSCK